VELDRVQPMAPGQLPARAAGRFDHHPDQVGPPGERSSHRFDLRVAGMPGAAGLEHDPHPVGTGVDGALCDRGGAHAADLDDHRDTPAAAAAAATISAQSVAGSS